jgi:type IV pilus assembly protein PilV
MLNLTINSTNGKTGMAIGRSGGFSLIEVLVSILIFAIGVLGIASMQAHGMKLAKDTQSLGSSVFLANSIVEKMRANMSGVEEGGYKAITGSESLIACARACTQVQRATNDSYEWNSMISAAMPGGKGTVKSIDDNGTAADWRDDLYQVEIVWTETIEGLATDKSQMFALEVRL